MLRTLLIRVGNEPVTNCNWLNIQVEDVKLRLTGVGMVMAIFRIIQSIHEGRRFTFIYEKICLALIKS